MNLRRILGLAGAALAVVCLQLACVDLPADASVSGTTLYVYDGASGNVLVWNDASTVFDATTLPAADRTISGNSLTQIKALGWGGMAMDPTSNRLLLVSQTGKVVRIERVRSQSGNLSGVTDIALFTIKGSTSLDGGKSTFGQAAVDRSTGTLYVTETTDTAARVLVVTSPGSIADGDTVTPSEMVNSGDFKGTGVASAQGSVFAYFGGGDNIKDSLATIFSGARVRRNSGSSFPATSQVIINSDAALGTTGSLALDTSNNLLYVLCIGPSGTVLDPPIRAYNFGAFTSSFGQKPYATLGTAAGQPNLRFITHAGSKDWLGGAEMVNSMGTTQLWLWRNPKSSDAPKAFTLAGGQILGLAFDGSN